MVGTLGWGKRARFGVAVSRDIWRRGEREPHRPDAGGADDGGGRVVY